MIIIIESNEEFLINHQSISSEKDQELTEIAVCHRTKF
jgi:hypothetical protein